MTSIIGVRFHCKKCINFTDSAKTAGNKTVEVWRNNPDDDIKKAPPLRRRIDAEIVNDWIHYCVVCEKVTTGIVYRSRPWVSIHPREGSQ